jgi:hypothetical protein
LPALNSNFFWRFRMFIVLVTLSAILAYLAPLLCSVLWRIPLHVGHSYLH